MSFSIVILAAGKGTRMASNKAKTLQVLAGKPMLINILEQATTIGSDQVIIVHSPEEIDEIKKTTKHLDDLTLVEQLEPQGTGHALKQAQSAIKQDNNVLVLLGDVPLVKSNTLLNLIENSSSTLFVKLLSPPKIILDWVIISSLEVLSVKNSGEKIISKLG